MEKMLEYKGKPLVRSGNTLYYGNRPKAALPCSRSFPPRTMRKNRRPGAGADPLHR